MLVGDLGAPFVGEVAARVRSSKKTAFVAGAGISCSAGIPDFRSDDGLYNLVKQRFPTTFVKGKDLFDSILFRDAKSAEVFYSFIAELRAATVKARPTPTHHFLRLLKDKNRLLRVYTQNIDGLELEAGLGPADVVQLHGDLHALRCGLCGTRTGWTPELAAEMVDGDAPDCAFCASASLARQLSGKRSTSVGQLRPDIVLYGEDHPAGDDIAAVLRKDCAKKTTNLLVVSGTSLRVHGLKRLVKLLAQTVHANGGIAVLVNKSNVSMSEWGTVFDYHVQTGVDEWVQDLRARVPNFFEKQSKIKVERKRRPQAGAVLAKRTKSDPYADKLNQDALLRTPESVRSRSASSTPRLASPSSQSSFSLDVDPLQLVPGPVPDLKLEPYTELPTETAAPTKTATPAETAIPTETATSTETSEIPPKQEAPTGPLSPAHNPSYTGRSEKPDMEKTSVDQPGTASGAYV